MGRAGDTPQGRRGNTGTGDTAERSVAAQMLAQAGEEPHDAFVLLGDLVYEDRDSALVRERVSGPFAPVLDAGTELLPVLGNHDVASGRGSVIMTALGRETRWYREQVRCVDLIVLDSTQVQDLAQTRWLERQLADPRPQGTWTLAVMHHPAYSAGQHGSEAAVRGAWHRCSPATTSRWCSLATTTTTSAPPPSRA